MTMLGEDAEDSQDKDSAEITPLLAMSCWANSIFLHIDRAPWLNVAPASIHLKFVIRRAPLSFLQPLA